jgi:competence protein ComFC
MKARHSPKNPMPPPDVFRSVKVFSARLTRNATSLVFPDLCIVCRNRCTMKNAWLCEQCVSRLIHNHRNRDACPLCSQNRRVRPCACEYAWDHPFEKIYSLFDFDDTIKHLAHAFKYGGLKRLAFDMGRTFCPLIPPDFFKDIDAVVPVPLHFVRKLKRGYNQAEWFGRGIIASHQAKLFLCTHALKRRRATKTQTMLSKEQRVKNLAGALWVPPAKTRLVSGKSVILVDDIVTTGATTGQCALALIEAGAKRVRVLSFGRD